MDIENQMRYKIKKSGQYIGLPHSFGIPYFMENEFYVGYGCYYRELDISEEDLRKRIYLEFLGVFQCAEIYLNEEFVGKHEGGYTSFVVDLTERCRAGKNELLVRVNSIWNARRLQQQDSINLMGEFIEMYFWF